MSVQNLPNSDNEFWEGAEKMLTTASPIPMCSDHFAGNWTHHDGYKQDEQGLITCTKCPWGTKAPGYYKVHEGKIIDLRSLNRE